MSSLETHIDRSGRIVVDYTRPGFVRPESDGPWFCACDKESRASEPATEHACSEVARFGGDHSERPTCEVCDITVRPDQVFCEDCKPRIGEKS